MYVKVNGVFVKLAFLVPLLIIFLGCGIMGRSLALLYFANNSLTSTFLLIAYIAGIYAVSFGLGGIMATFVSLALAFTQVGFVPGAIAVVTTGLIIWLGFQDLDATDSSRDKNLTPQEWGLVAATVAFGSALTVTMIQSTSGMVAGIFTGAIAGAIAVFGIQLKSSDTGIAKPSRLLLVGSIVSLSIGLVYGYFTYSPIVPS